MVYDTPLTSRLLLGTAQYPSPQVLRAAIAASGAEVITVSLRREGPEGGAFREYPAKDERACCEEEAETCFLKRPPREHPIQCPTQQIGRERVVEEVPDAGDSREEQQSKSRKKHDTCRGDDGSLGIGRSDDHTAFHGVT